MSEHNLKKLHTQGLPTLEGEDPTALNIALWLLRLESWSRTHSRYDYIFRRLPAAADADAAAAQLQKQEESLRILIAAIQSKTLTLDLTTRPFTHAHDAVTSIRARWLGGGRDPNTLCI